jgi:hypothetical protein
VEAGDSNLVTFDITDLANGTPYYYWIKAVFPGVGESALSPMGTGMPVSPPQIPENFNIEVHPGEGLLDIRWPSVPDAVTYEVYTKAGGAGDSPPADADFRTVSSRGALVSGLANDQVVGIWVRASNTAGKSGYAAASGTPAAASALPAAVTGSISATPGKGKLTLTWDQVEGVPSYRLFYNTENNSAGAQKFSVLVPADSPAVTAELSGLKNGVLYYVWVKSSNSQGVSGFSSSFASGTPQPKAPIQWNLAFELGEAAAEYPFAQEVPLSVFFPDPKNTLWDRLTRIQETALGNLFADGAAWYARENYPEENIDFVFLNGGYIDNGLRQGKITVGGLSAIVGPGSRNSDKLVFLSLTGAQLKTFFAEVAYVVHMGRGGANTGWFGIASEEVMYTIQYPRPPEGTSPPIEDSAEREPYYRGRIKEGTLKIKRHDSPGYEDIDDARTYRICTTDYIADAAYFITLLDATDIRRLNVLFWHAVAEYIYDKGTVVPDTDGRIMLEGGVPLPPPWNRGNWTDWQGWPVPPVSP